MDITDKTEWEDTYNLIEDGEDMVMSELSIGKYVTLSKKVFDALILEINESRLKNGDTSEGIDLIIIEGDSGEKSD